jgi:hypothetical protein
MHTGSLTWVQNITPDAEISSLCLFIDCCETEPTENQKGTAGEYHTLGVLEFSSGVEVSGT